MTVLGFKSHRWVAVLMAGLCLCGLAAAQYPDRTITIIVPVGPGGGTDLMAREIGRKLSEAWGQPVVIDNKPGGAGNIGAQAVLRAQPNGYTLLFTHDGVITATPKLYKATSYDPQKDFVPITEVAKTGYLVVVNPGSAGANVAGADRADEGQEGQEGDVRLCHVGARQRRSSVRRVVQAFGRRRHAGRSLQATACPR